MKHTIDEVKKKKKNHYKLPEWYPDEIVHEGCGKYVSCLDGHSW